jgi:hypothetical protein
LVTRLTINNEVLAEEFFSDAQLLGIQCSMEPHSFIWLINKRFLYQFRYQNGAEIIVQKRQRNFSFPVFQCQESNLQLTHLIYTNQQDGEYLLPELKHFDYIWMLKGELSNIDLPDLVLKELKNVPDIQMVALLATDKIRNKTQLVM